jgi:hypothetical protein
MLQQHVSLFLVHFSNASTSKISGSFPVALLVVPLIYEIVLAKEVKYKHDYSSSAARLFFVSLLYEHLSSGGSWVLLWSCVVG